MSLIRPFTGFDSDIDRAFSSWNNRFDQLFRNFENNMGQFGAVVAPGSLATRSAMDFMPSLDVVDTEKEVVVHTELPGMKKEDIHVEVEGSTLVVRGESRKDDKYEDQRWRVRERSFGKFERRVLLPKESDVNNIAANYDNGVLEIKVAKKPQSEAQRKAITIQ
jgi:HSP20 family protein